jgi:integrase
LHLIRRRPRYAAEAVRAIRYGLGGLLKRPAARISRTEAVNALDRIVKANKPLMASRTMAYARACFSWAEKRGKVSVNPFANLPIAAVRSERERVLADDELRAIWAASGTLGYPWGPFFRLAILTLQRREEVAGMRWSEIAADLSMWTIPGSRMKNGKAHDVHLSEAARAVLREIPRTEGCDFVLSTTGKTPISGFSAAKAALDKVIDRDLMPVRPWRLHDLRRTGVTKLAELGFDSIVVDKILAHQPAKLRGVAGVYQRYDFARERAAALDAWAAHVAAIEQNNVISLRSAHYKAEINGMPDRQ